MKIYSRDLLITQRNIKEVMLSLLTIYRNLDKLGITEIYDNHKFYDAVGEFYEETAFTHRYGANRKMIVELFTEQEQLVVKVRIVASVNVTGKDECVHQKEYRIDKTEMIPGDTNSRTQLYEKKDAAKREIPGVLNCFVTAFRQFVPPLFAEPTVEAIEGLMVHPVRGNKVNTTQYMDTKKSNMIRTAV